MRQRAVLVSLVASLSSTSHAVAAPGDPLADPRRELPEPAEATLSLRAHGEYQVRLDGLSRLPLRPPPGQAEPDELGQRYRLEHWLRLRAQLALGTTGLGRKLALVGQADFPRGYFLGPEAELVGAARDAFNDRQPLRAEARWLFLEWVHQRGRLRLGQQPVHWGLGIWTNDGDHRTFFSDYRRGARSERARLDLVPSADLPLRVGVAAGVVFEDARSSLLDGELAVEVASELVFGRPTHFLGVMVVQREERASEAEASGLPKASAGYWLASTHGGLQQPIVGTDGVFFLETEAVVRRGERNGARSLDAGSISIAQYGAVAQVGFQLLYASTSDRAEALRSPWLRLALEWGWASGDGDPSDGVDRRFRFDPNHRVGLLLFEEVLAWKTARAATIAGAGLTRTRPIPEATRQVTNGGVAGATYVNPTLLVRPRPWLDVKLGMVLAQRTADDVDATTLIATGRAAGLDGQEPSRRDLGLELDAGVETRLPLDERTLAELGAQAGLLLPGAALGDGSGGRLPEQWIATLRMGLQF